MQWHVRVARSAAKTLSRVPRDDATRLRAALEEMRADPFAGDISRLTAQPAGWRRRVGDWCIFFDIDSNRRLVDVSAIRRRTSTTY